MLSAEIQMPLSVQEILLQNCNIYPCLLDCLLSLPFAALKRILARKDNCRTNYFEEI